MRRIPQSTERGFTLLEAVLYIGIIAIFLVGVTYFAFTLRSTRMQYMARSDVHNSTSQILETIDYLIRNSDGLVQDASGNDCFSTSTLMLYYSTSSSPYLPYGCLHGAVTGAVGVERYQFGTSTAASRIVNRSNAYYGGIYDSGYLYALGDYQSIDKRHARDLRYDTRFANGGTTMTPDVNDTNDIDRDAITDDTYIYTVGVDYYSGANHTYIEKRNKNSGVLDTSFGTNGVINTTVDESAIAIVADDSYLYVVSNNAHQEDVLGVPTWFYYGTVEKRRKSSGTLCTNASPCDSYAFDSDGIRSYRSTGKDFLYDAAIDGQYLYLVGGEVGGGTWYILKIRTSDAASCTAGLCGTDFDSDGEVAETTAGWANAVLVDSGSIFVGGGDGTNARVEKRHSDTGALCAVADPCNGSDFDTDGALPIAKAGVPYVRLALGSDGLFVTATDYASEAVAGDWYLEKRSRSTGALVTSFGSSGVVTFSSTPTKLPYLLATDDSLLYIGGTYLWQGLDVYSIQRRRQDTGAPEGWYGTRLVCYQGYPTFGKPSTCSSLIPTYSGAITDLNKVYTVDLDDPYRMVRTESLTFATTTVGSKLAIESTLQTRYTGATLNFTVAPYTASTTTSFRQSQ